MGDTPSPTEHEPLTDDTPRIHGHPVERSDGARLAFSNTSSRTIHPIPTRTDCEAYDLRQRQSLCGSFGSKGGAYTSAEAMYVLPDEFDVEYIVRDGDVRGKLCGNCQRRLD
jgi:hypothetical protein